MLACPRCGSAYLRDVGFCGLDGERLGEFERDPLIGRTIDRYRVDAILGDGGMARVYRATHVHLEQAVALKILFGDMASDRAIAERFRREAQSAAQIQHPNVVHVTDFGVTREKISFLTMELLHGPTLSDVVRGHGRLEPRRAAELVRQVALGLEAAHALGFIHRDLKPKNVMVVSRAGQEVVKILDFGLVRPLDDAEVRLTQKGQIFGTPAYMAPEQISDGTVDARTDLYALGAMLYELLSGHPPFDGVMGEVFRKHLSEAPRPLADAGPLGDLALLLLSKAPAARPSSAREVVELVDSLGLSPPVPSLILSGPPRAIAAPDVAAAADAARTPANAPRAPANAPGAANAPAPTGRPTTPGPVHAPRAGSAVDRLDVAALGAEPTLGVLPEHSASVGPGAWADARRDAAGAARAPAPLSEPGARPSRDPLGVGVVDSHELSAAEIRRAMRTVDDGRRLLVLGAAAALGLVAGLAYWAFGPRGAGVEPLPTPPPSIAPSPSATLAPTASASPSARPTPSASASPSASPSPSSSASASPNPGPSASARPRPTELPDPAAVLRSFAELDAELREQLDARDVGLADLAQRVPEEAKLWRALRAAPDGAQSDARFAAFRRLMDVAKQLEPSDALVRTKLARVRALVEARPRGREHDAELARLSSIENEARSKLDARARKALIRRLSFFEQELAP